MGAFSGLAVWDGVDYRADQPSSNTVALAVSDLVTYERQACPVCQQELGGHQGRWVK